MLLLFVSVVYPRHFHFQSVGRSMNSSGGFTCYLISKMFCSDLVYNKLKEKFDSISKTVKIFCGLTRYRLKSTKTICSFI
jgi:hypothetical protein